MSGIILAAIAGLLTPQAAPHPSTQALYTAPAIRPFEPGPDFGLEIAEGDVESAPHRAPLTAPVTVDAYDGAYEVTPTDAQAAYEQGVDSAEIRADQTAGPMDGGWRLVDADGRTLYDLVLMDSGSGAAEGGWRNARDSGAAVFDGGTLTLEGAGEVTLERSRNGWSGRLTVGGEARPVTLTPAD
ncbi:MAG TPA: hypothetical protein VFF66_05665 [Brevundimonas sp.]|nr:hypothetical protein [Brevundimonas sp.]